MKTQLNINQKQFILAWFCFIELERNPSKKQAETLVQAVMQTRGYSGVWEGTRMGRGNGCIVKTLSRDISPYNGVEVVGGRILRKVCAKSLKTGVLKDTPEEKEEHRIGQRKLNS